MTEVTHIRNHHNKNSNVQYNQIHRVLNVSKGLADGRYHGPPLGPNRSKHR
jgi:hypothetical protein